MPRSSYGVDLAGINGTERIQCSTRTEAERVRRTIELWKKELGSTAADTLIELAQLAKDRPGIPAHLIVGEYRRTH